MDSDHWKLSSDEHQNATQYERTHAAADRNIDNVDLSNLGDDIHLEAEPSSCSSSSSEASFDEDLFQIEATELSEPMAGLDEMLAADLSSHISVEEVLSISGVGVASNHQVMKNSQNSHMIDTEPILPSKLEVETAFSPNYLAGGPESDTYGSHRVTQSPPIQSMDRSDIPDPNRIPSSIFVRTNTTMEWSAASNESLFSIHIGKSGDLTEYYVDQLESYPPISPLVGSSSVKNLDLEPEIQQPDSAEAANAETMKEVLQQAAEVHAAKNKPSIEGIHCDSTPRYSDGSMNSYRSFAFPILTVDGRNGSPKSESVYKQKAKVQPQPPPFQLEESPKAEPAASRRRWFSWCTCLFRCCCCC